MGKKQKKSVELSDQKINFMIQKISYKAIRYYPTAMSLDVMVTDEDGTKLGMQNIPFAHIPKEIKKIIKPN
ncbi:hypothetical protein SMGD1_0955 [Sulfurimonas gotlandica GD1]|uniref:Uncharacterized protein n=1 Tax=Sulfurimonas gotlandica (strain DSM 19862 / JCM 16533 / GD1) TaxID=929558 RepID=B6BLU7_SULGG|nr:hypothetical protein [Sulfurimonas gotlandica]EDZ61907.1 conserved hypothetical protein [Sulfurimonas gotlandica GD1]EHP29481.1 hypothetical protein SMGD1_0955 [Sulfurimonas gotlandica GD1]